MSTEENDRDDIEGFVWDSLMAVEFTFKPVTQEPFKPFKD
jgi:hypothetical protein